MRCHGRTRRARRPGSRCQALCFLVSTKAFSLLYATTARTIRRGAYPKLGQLADPNKSIPPPFSHRIGHRGGVIERPFFVPPHRKILYIDSLTTPRTPKQKARALRKKDG
jgi:hypothetical protein